MYDCMSKNCFYEGAMEIVKIMTTLTGNMVQESVTIATVFGGLYGLQLSRDYVHNKYLVLMHPAVVHT